MAARRNIILVDQPSASQWHARCDQSGAGLVASAGFGCSHFLLAGSPLILHPAPGPGIGCAPARGDHASFAQGQHE